ncbi:SsgA family sporulation/cell division regulator [Planobispora siamensis]|uniref:Uncharacterized protein n=1 Tax=Planobispora siamensis TaxID=936338 RepID=A0A8J3WJQ8_9ACTN|nr:SsgA family sporulation/cell division regulator [Planobispora siamensis]GIH91908.1 hypothetical protein Psi01_25380 [Planobispora siamensis]
MSTVTEGLTLWPVAEPTTPLPAVLAYSTTSPCEIKLAFMNAGLRETFDYSFDRDLLADALIADADQIVGVGTVQARQGEPLDYLVLRLWQDDGTGGGEWWELLVSQKRIEEIVQQIYALVPMGAERELLTAQLDTALAAILSEAAR